MQSGRQDTLEERYAIKFCFKLEKIPEKPMECFRLFSTILYDSSISFWVGMRFKEGSESVRDDERCGRSKEVNTPELIGQRVRVEVLRELRKKLRRKRPALFKSSQWHFHLYNTPVHNSILVTDYLTKMCIKTVRHPPYSPDLAPCDFWLFLKLRGYRHETIEEMKEAVTKVIDTLTH